MQPSNRIGNLRKLFELGKIVSYGNVCYVYALIDPVADISYFFSSYTYSNYLYWTVWKCYLPLVEP